VLWPLELGNVLLQAERRGRIEPRDVGLRLDLLLLMSLPILTDDGGTARALREVLMLARAEKPTTYNAAYLGLAMRQGLPLFLTSRL
jgi:predicted nucleic acid-binding protein